jgi:hypothetical protein
VSRAGRFVVTLRCTAPNGTRCFVTVTVSAAGRRTASARDALRPGRTKLDLRLDRRARRSLARRRRLRLVVSVRLSEGATVTGRVLAHR